MCEERVVLDDSMEWNGMEWERRDRDSGGTIELKVHNE